jgi:drug/metabolite transporter (DMT)-like permease
MAPGPVFIGALLLCAVLLAAYLVLERRKVLGGVSRVALFVCIMLLVVYLIIASVCLSRLG